MMASQAGIIRHLQFIARNAKCQHGQKDPTTWQMQIEGCLSEYALSQYLGIHWEGAGEIGGTDVGKDEEVRVTPISNGHLILHPSDKDDKRFWLLTGKNGVYQVRGYLYGRDGKKPEFWKTIHEKDDDGVIRDRSCYWIPQSFLFQKDQEYVSTVEKHFLDD